MVIHYTAMQSCAAARARLCDPAAEVSAHWLIAEDGTSEALVDESVRAWHAGVGSWGRVDDVNSRSIGIELANTGTHPFPEPQMVALEHLLAQIIARWNIRPERIIGHSDLAPGRKPDPGARFDWRRLARQGLSIWEDADPALADMPFLPSARRFGYSADVPQDDLLNAFRLRFRPYASGAQSADDRALMATLAARYPVADAPQQ